jgi:hypothetical protein
MSCASLVGGCTELMYTYCTMYVVYLHVYIHKQGFIKIYLQVLVWGWYMSLHYELAKVFFIG